MVDASEYLEQDPMPAISSDNEDDAEDTEESSPILLSSKLLNYASTHIRRPSGSLDRPKAITSMDELFKPVNYDVQPLKQAPLPPALPPTIFADKELALGQGRNHTGKIYGKQRNFPVKPHMTTNIAAPASRIRLHERVNARYSNGVTVLGGNHSHSISGIRQSYNSVVTDDITGAALSSSLSRTPSLSASSSRSCESLVSSASSSSSLSSSSSIPVTRRLSSNRSAGSLPSYRNSAILTDSSASSSTTSRIARKSSTSRIPTMASIGASPVTVATSMDEEKKTEEIIHSCAVAPVLNRRYSSADAYTSTMTSPPIRPSMSHRRHQSNQSISEKLILEEEEEDDSTNQLLTR
ncbi:hypothetical protein BDF19DRAFT_314341 [Syncephalis fuscata]|nr:hypothetical protein BDF19DRAFT_314341 [Syncephalis fuscata]